jgi:hypothetical protein
MSTVVVFQVVLIKYFLAHVHQVLSPGLIILRLQLHCLFFFSTQLFCKSSIERTNIFGLVVMCIFLFCAFWKNVTVQYWHCLLFYKLLDCASLKENEYLS